MKLYIASDVKHAKQWINFRELAYPQIVVVSSWIDVCKNGEPTNWSDELIKQSWDHNIKDIILCDALLLYHERGDRLRGSLFEAGMAFAMGKITFYVGDPGVLGSVGVCFDRFSTFDDAGFALQEMETAKVIDYLRPRAN